MLQPVYWSKLFAFYNPDIFIIPVIAGVAGKIQKHQDEDEQEKQCIFLISRHVGQSNLTDIYQRFLPDQRHENIRIFLHVMK